MLFEESGISYEKVLFDPLPKLDSLEKFGITNEKKELITSSSNEIIELLTKMESNENISQLGDKKCLMDESQYIRLFINTQGTLSFQYKEKIIPDANENLITREGTDRLSSLMSSYYSAVSNTATYL